MTFDVTIGVNYSLFLGMGTREYDLTGLVCPGIYNWRKRSYFTDNNWNNHWVWMSANITNHSVTWDWTITGSYLNPTLRVTPAGNDAIYFSRTDYDPIIGLRGEPPVEVRCPGASK